MTGAQLIASGLSIAMSVYELCGRIKMLEDFKNIHKDLVTG